MPDHFYDCHPEKKGRESAKQDQKGREIRDFTLENFFNFWQSTTTATTTTINQKSGPFSTPRRRSTPTPIIYDNFGKIYDNFRKEIAFSYKVVVRSPITDPYLCTVVYGKTGQVGRTLRAKGPSSWLHATHSAVANRQGHARRDMAPFRRGSLFRASEHALQ